MKYVETEGKIFIKTYENLKNYPLKDSWKKGIPLQKWKKNENWKTFYENCTEPVQSNALQEAVGYGHAQLQVTSPQWHS